MSFIEYDRQMGLSEKVILETVIIDLPRQILSSTEFSCQKMPNFCLCLKVLGLI